MQHPFKLLASTDSLFFDVQQFVQVGLDLAFMPGQHDGVDIRKVLVKMARPIRAPWAIADIVMNHTP